MTFYIAAQVLALAAILTSAAPVWLQLICLLSCLAHAGYVVPRSVLLSRRGSWRGLRHDEDGWHLWNQQQGWQPIQLLPDSLALPLVVVLRFVYRAGAALTVSASRVTRCRASSIAVCGCGSSSVGEGGRRQDSVKRLG